MGAIGCDICNQWLPPQRCGCRLVIEQHLIECLARKYRIRPDQMPGGRLVRWHVDLDISPPITDMTATICVVANSQKPFYRLIAPQVSFDLDTFWDLYKIFSDELSYRLNLPF